MAHSLKTLKANFAKYYSLVYNYMLRFVYYGSVPTIILYGNILIVFNEGYRIVCKAVQSHCHGNDGVLDWTAAGTGGLVRGIRRTARLLLMDGEYI